MDGDTEKDSILKPLPITYFCRKWFPEKITHSVLEWNRDASARLKMNQTMTMRLCLGANGSGIEATVMGQAGFIDAQFFSFVDYYAQGTKSLNIFVKRKYAPLRDDPDQRFDRHESRDFQISHGNESILRHEIHCLAWEFGDISNLSEVEAGLARGKDQMTEDIKNLFNVWA